MRAAQHCGVFAFCTALLPFAHLVDWSRGLELSAALDDERDAKTALESTIARLRGRLREAYASQKLQEALFVASPSLAERYAYWAENPSDDEAQEIEHALVLHYSQLTAACKVTGLRGGISAGTIGKHSTLTIAPSPSHRRCVRLDLAPVAAIATALENDAAERRRLRYTPNPTLCRVGPVLEYVESPNERNGQSYNIVALEPSPFVQALLDSAGTGATVAELVSILERVGEPVSSHDAEAFIDEVISSQVLVSTLQPAPTGEPPFVTLVRDSMRLEDGSAASAVLHRIASELNLLNMTSLGVSTDRYRAIANILETLIGGPTLSSVFHVDLVKPSAASLGPAVIDELMRGLRVLRRFSSDPASAAMTRFKKDFARRYEGREVPLVEALHQDFGVGFGTAEEFPDVLKGIPFPNTLDTSPVWTKRDSYLLAKLQALPPGADELEIADTEAIPADAHDAPKFPRAVHVTFSVETESAEALEDGRLFLCFDAPGGPSPADVLTRACHSDSELTDGVMAHVRQEEARDPDALFAEIVHLPRDATAVVSHPAFRTYEIVCSGSPSVPPPNRISLTDLMVSIRGDRVTLRSRRLNRRIRPRITAPGDAPRGPAIYRFLCALHQEDAAGISFDWGRLHGSRFLPRVVSGRCILAFAQWTVSRDEFAPLTIGSQLERLHAFLQLCRRLRLPRYFRALEGDDWFPVDAENALSADGFIQRLRRHDVIRLVEMRPAHDRLAVNGPEGRFVSQIVLPLVEEGPAVPRAAPQHYALRPMERLHTPSSAWLFVKLYCGSGNVDRVLRDVVTPVVRQAVEENAIDRWFFVRYGDPDWHVRLRVHGEPGTVLQRVMPIVDRGSHQLVNDGTIWKIQLDTYRQEIERYGGPEAMPLAEDVFCADSEAALDIFSGDPGDIDVDARFRLTLLGMYRLLDDFRLCLDDKRQTVRSLRAASLREHRADERSLQSLRDAYHRERTRLESTLQQTVGAFERRSSRLRSVAARLRGLADNDRLAVTIPELCRSYLHMHANRMLLRDARRQELVLYDFLARLYDGHAARHSSA